MVGSILATLIPCFPLISIYESFWSESSSLSKGFNTAAYCLIIIMGVFYTIGSFAFMRHVEEDRPKPLFSCSLFISDELLGMWMFTLGTLPSVPVMSIYVAYNSANGAYKLALILCVLFTLGTLLLTISLYPTFNKRKGVNEPLFINLMKNLKSI